MPIVLYCSTRSIVSAVTFIYIYSKAIIPPFLLLYNIKHGFSFSAKIYRQLCLNENRVKLYLWWFLSGFIKNCCYISDCYFIFRNKILTNMKYYSLVKIELLYRFKHIYNKIIFM